MVDLPEPVGPVTSRMPCGRSMSCLNVLYVSGSMPTLARLNTMRPLSRSRMTMPSPWTIGMIETRTSISRPWTRILMRPSCGRRFSAMFSRAMILMRLTIAA